MPGLGLPELLIILVIVLVIFGASRLTDIMGALGRGVGEFRKGAEMDATEKKNETPPETKTPTK